MSCGFGKQSFGDGPFGESDWAEHYLWDQIPRVYKVFDKLVNLPYRKFIDAIKDPFNDLRAKREDFIELRSANEVPIEQLEFLSRDYGIESDKSRSERLRRSKVRNIVQQLKLKGTDKGYRIVGTYEGYIIEVIGVWEFGCNDRKDPSTTPPFQEFSFGETKYVNQFDVMPADVQPLDQTYTDRYVEHPNKDGFITRVPADGETAVTKCRTQYLNIIIRPGPTLTSFNFDDVLGIVDELFKVKPIHVRFLNLVYTIRMSASNIIQSGGMDSVVTTKHEADQAQLYDSVEADAQQTDGPFVAWME